MKLFGKDLDTDVAVVAEVGVNHEGSIEKARELIQFAAAAGADAVKLQTYTPERYASASDPERLKRVAGFSLGYSAHQELAAYAAQLRVPLFSTALTEDVVPFLAEWCPAIKIASGDLTFEPVIRAVAGTGKPMIVSTGNGTVEEIDRAVEWCRETMGTKGMEQRLVLMHCVSAYPTPIDQANVLSVPYLKERYGLAIGYSNHVVEHEAVLAATALGAKLIEVHVTDRKSGRAFRDHALSYEPSELQALIRSVRRVQQSLGSWDKPVQACERPLRDVIRKGLVAARDLNAGTVLTKEDLMYARPATEIPAGESPRIVGRIVTRALLRGELICRRDLT